MDSIFPPLCQMLALSPHKLVILTSLIYTVEFGSKHHFHVLEGFTKYLQKFRMSQPAGLRFQLMVEFNSKSQSSEDRKMDSLKTGVKVAK